MKPLKFIILLGFYFCSVCVLTAQTNFSIISRLADTVSTERLFPLVSTNQINVLSSGLEFGPVYGFNRVLRLGQYSFQGAFLQSTQLDPSSLQAYQIINHQPIISLDDNLLVAADQFYPDPTSDPQRTVIFGLDQSGQVLWKQEFADPDYLSTSGVLVADGNDGAYCLSIRATIADSDQDISIRHLNAAGQVDWTKHIALPNTSEREYLYVHSSIWTGEKIIAVCSYGLISSPSTYYLLITLDSNGSFVSSEELSGLNSPLLSNLTGRDTFFFDSYNISNNQVIHCLKTYQGDFSNNLSIVCSDNLTNEISLIPSDLKVAPSGFAYTVGERDSANTRIGWLAKWTNSGELIWNKFYHCSVAQPDGNCFFYGIHFLPDGNIVLAGQARETSSQFSPRYNWLLTLDDDGCYNGDCNETVTVVSEIVAAGNPVVLTPTDWRIWPNPANDYITITTARKGWLTVYNATGASVTAAIPTPAGVSHYPVSDWPTGVYFVRFWEENGNNGSMQTLLVLSR